MRRSYQVPTASRWLQTRAKVQERDAGTPALNSQPLLQFRNQVAAFSIRISSTIVGFNNVDRVGVLKGPQGTLFGRNATGGVIHMGQYPEPEYGLLSAALTWTSPQAKYDVQVYCSNCTDRYHDTFITESGPEIQKAGADPRFYGIKVGAHF